MRRHRTGVAGRTPRHPGPSGQREVGAAGCSGVSGRLGRPEIDPQGEDPVVDVGLGIAEHGEVHKVDLGLLLETLPIRTFHGWQPPGSDGVRPRPESLHHRLGVELFRHGPMVPGLPVRHE